MDTEAEVCYIKKLDKTFGKQVAEYRSHKDTPMTLENSVEIYAAEMDSSELGAVGATIRDFCGDYPTYKLGSTEVDSRHIFARFRYCYPCSYYCYFTTLIVPTGSTVVFYWFFG